MSRFNKAGFSTGRSAGDTNVVGAAVIEELLEFCEDVSLDEPTVIPNRKDIPVWEL